VAQLQAVWNKLNPRERLEAIGAGLIVLSFLVAIVTYGFGTNSLALIGAIAVLVVLYLKYAGQNINWPASTTLILGVIAAVVALAVLLDLLTSLRWIGFYGAAIIALALEVIGAAIMAWGAWQEYQLEKPELPDWARGASAGATGTATPTPPPTAPSAPPVSAPPAPSMDDHDEAPPA
jgi:hypothetical protein